MQHGIGGSCPEFYPWDPPGEAPVGSSGARALGSAVPLGSWATGRVTCECVRPSFCRGLSVAGRERLRQGCGTQALLSAGWRGSSCRPESGASGLKERFPARGGVRDPQRLDPSIAQRTFQGHQRWALLLLELS